MGRLPRMLRRSIPAALALMLALPVLPAAALDGAPQGDKQMERHVFRDVQLGISHPAGTSPAAQPQKPPGWTFPWMPLFGAPAGSQTGSPPK